MRPIEDVRAEIVGRMKRLPTETVSFLEASGRILSDPVVSREDIPGFANSSMDGFAVRSSDTSPGATLLIVDDVPAGQVATVAVGAGEAIRIMTGAPMPEGADAVVRVEDTTVDDDKVTVSGAVEPGTYIRPAGGDVKAGDEVLKRGSRLSAVHIGVLATLGAVDVAVSTRPIAAVFSTGDELEPPETETLGPGMIRDSNRFMLAELLTGASSQVLDLGRVPDDADAFRATVGRAAVEADVIVTSAGVSMGDYDVTKLVLRDEADVDFMQVAMKPGKPLGFGFVGGTPFFGLPGNPVSSLVSFENFVRPALLSMQGASRLMRPRVTGTAGSRIPTDPAKTTFIRVVVDESWVATEAGSQDSNALSAAGNADAFAVIPRGVGIVEPGEPLVLELFRSPEIREAVDVE